MYTLLRFFFGGSPQVSLAPETNDNIFSYPVVEYAPALQKRGVQHLDAIIAASDYHSAPLLQDAIRSWKYAGVTKNGEVLARLFAQRVTSHLSGDFVICSVPLHWTRQLSRGFNQSDVLAHALSSQIACPVLPLLKRKKSTGHQAHRSRIERFLAIDNAFSTTTEKVPRSIILVDDLATTGATLNACAKILRQYGATRIVGCVLAHG